MPHLVYSLRDDTPPCCTPDPDTFDGHAKTCDEWEPDYEPTGEVGNDGSREMREAYKATDWTARHAEQINNLTGQLVVAEHDAILVRSHMDDLAERIGYWVKDGGYVSVDLLAELLVENVRPAQRRIGRLIDTVRAES